MIIVMNDAGQLEPVQGEHRDTFATAAECYEAARGLYVDAPASAQSVSIVCIKDPSGRDA